MSVAQWSRQFFLQTETGDNTLGTPNGSDLLNNLPNLLASTLPTFDADQVGLEGDGLTGGKHKLLLSNKPSIMPATAVQDDRKSTGTPDPSEKDIEITIAEPPNTDLEMNLSAYAINTALLLLLQQGSTEAYVTSLKATEAITSMTVADESTLLISATGIGADVPDAGYAMSSVSGEVFEYSAISARPDGDFTVTTRGAKGTTAAAMTGDLGGLALVETTFKPYDTAEALYYGALLEKTRKLYAGAGNVYESSVLARGCIAKTFNMTFDEGGIAKGTIGLSLAKWLNTYDAGPSGDGPVGGVTSPASAMASLKWQNAYVYLADWDATMSTTDSKIWLQSISFNGANNATSHFYNSDEVKNFTLGDTVFTGNLVIPWVANAERNEYYWAQIDAFRNGAKKRIKIAWGNEGATDLSELGIADNGFLIDMYIQYSGADRGGDNAIVSEMEFKNILPEGKTESFVFKTYTYAGRLDRGL